MGLSGCAVVALAGWVLNGWGVEETDNAQLQAHLVEISSRAAGTVQAVPVHDDQAVAPRALLVVLDPRDGQRVQPGQPLITLVEAPPWVEANFKETQLEGLQPGQRAEIRIDAFPGRTLRGHLLSVAPASGARFALLPPDNASGNFTKVVQRVTARIALEQVPPDLAPRLVPGLSATVRVRRS